MPRGPPHATTGPSRVTRSGTLSAKSSAGLSTPAAWLSSSLTVTASSARRTVRRWSLARASRPRRPSATSRSTAVAVTSAVTPGAADRGPLEVGVALGDPPPRAPRLAAAQDQGGQAELGVGVLGDREQLGHLGLGHLGLGLVG